MEIKISIPEKITRHPGGDFRLREVAGEENVTVVGPGVLECFFFGLPGWSGSCLWQK
jgi:hypothetical protein